MRATLSTHHVVGHRLPLMPLGATEGRFGEGVHVVPNHHQPAISNPLVDDLLS